MEHERIPSLIEWLDRVGPTDAHAVRGLVAEIDRLQAIEKAAQAVWEAVRRSHDQRAWFMPLSELATALGYKCGSVQD